MNSPSPSSQKKGRVVLWLGVILVVLAAVTVFVLRPVVAEVSAEIPPNFPTDSFSHVSFEELLEKFVTEDGKVDYERFSADAGAKEKLRLYLGAVARYSPDNDKKRFPSEADETAYWIYAYNALVISAILRRWPLSSVTDVKAPIEVVKGLGFFYKLKFTLGGEVLSLYEIEHKKVLERANDPRVHFVLNCGSGGCPVIRPKLPTGDELEPFLKEAASDFVSDPGNVRLDHEKKVLLVSKIFEWYEDDFVMELRRRGVSTKAGVAEYFPLVAPASMKAEFERARTYRVEFMNYDWAVNEGSSSK